MRGQARKLLEGSDNPGSGIFRLAVTFVLLARERLCASEQGLDYSFQTALLRVFIPYLKGIGKQVPGSTVLCVPILYFSSERCCSTPIITTPIEPKDARWINVRVTIVTVYGMDRRSTHRINTH